MKPLLKTECPVWKVNISIFSLTYVTTCRSRAVRRAAANTSAASFEYSFFLGLASAGKHTATSRKITSRRLHMRVLSSKDNTASDMPDKIARYPFHFSRRVSWKCREPVHSGDELPPLMWLFSTILIVILSLDSAA